MALTTTKILLLLLISCVLQDIVVAQPQKILQPSTSKQEIPQNSETQGFLLTDTQDLSGHPNQHEVTQYSWRQSKKRQKKRSVSAQNSYQNSGYFSPKPIEDYLMVSNRSSQQKGVLDKDLDQSLLLQKFSETEGHYHLESDQSLLPNPPTQCYSIQKVNCSDDTPKNSSSDHLKTDETEAQSNKFDATLNNQNDKTNLNNLKSILTKQLKGKIKYSRTLSACQRPHNLEAKVDANSTKTMNSQEDFSEDEQQLQGKNKEIKRLIGQMQAKTINLEKRSAHEIPWKPLNKFRNFSFETKADEGEQYDESKVNFIQTSMKKRHSFRPIFSAVLSSKGQLKNHQVPSLLHREDKHSQNSDRNIKTNNNSSSFVIENTFLMQQRSLFTNEILAQTHQELLSKKPNSRNTQNHSSPIRFQDNSKNPGSRFTTENVLRHGRTSSFKQSAIQDAQKHISKITQHQNSIDLCYGRRESQSTDSEDHNRFVSTQQQNSPFYTNVISMQQDQLPLTLKGFQPNPCPNTCGGVAKFRVLYKNSKKISIIKKNEISNSHLNNQEDQTLKLKYLEKGKQNIQEIQKDNFKTATSTTAEAKRNNFLIIQRLLTKNINNLTPNPKISQTIENLNENGNKNENNKNRSDSACDLFSQLNQSTRSNSLHIKLNQTLQFTPEQKKQRRQNFIFSQPKKKQEFC